MKKPMTSYLKATSWEAAFAALQQPDMHILAGGTDVYANEKFPFENSSLLDISNLKPSCLIDQTEQGWWLDAQLTWSEILATDIPSSFDALKGAARQIGGRQIQNAGTIGGNICNASPAADSVPVLLILDAKVEIRSSDGKRLVPIADFIKGRRRTILCSGEIVSRLFVPKPAASAHSDFLKIGSRAYLVISPVMAAGLISTDERGNIDVCRLSVGACSEVAVRLPAIEERVLGMSPDELQKFQPIPSDFQGLTPISDGRASADYRRRSAAVLIERLLQGLGAAHG